MALILNPFTALGSAIRGRNATQTAQADQGKAFRSQKDLYALRRGYYESTAYDLGTFQGGTYRAVQGLPRNIRAVMPIAKRVIEWWRGNLYPGTWTSDGRPSSSGKPNRIPWELDTPDNLVAAAQQLFTWGNWQSQILVWSFFGPMYGDVFAELEVDEQRRKVYPIVHDPQYVTDLEFNRSGDVISYRLDIPYWNDDAKQTYIWGKRVTQDLIITYYDGEELGYNDLPAVQPNPYGFCPAAWWMFRDVGGIHGGSVLDGMYPIMDEVNGLQSSVDDFILSFMKQKIIVGSDDPKRLFDLISQAQKLGPTDDFTNPDIGRESIPILPAPPGVTVARLIENLGLGDSAVHIDRVQQAIEHIIPEVTYEERMSQHNMVTGPGARAIAAPAQRNLDDAVGGTDHAIVKLGQMGVAMAGELFNSRWRSGLTDQEKKFKDFNLSSWPKGDLSPLSISPRELVQETFMERALSAAAGEKVQTVWGMRHMGASTGDIYGRDAEGNDLPAPPDPGILADRQAASAASAVNLGSLFNSGGAP